MLAGVSHDLRTPLTRMKLQLSLMKDDDAKKELEHDIIEMTAMLNSYVNFVRGAAPETIENINVNHLVKNICNSSISSEHIITDTYSKKIETSGRPLQIKRAIQNIIDNAKRYASKIHIEVSSNDEECFISISDDGPGIPQKNYEDVFKPFFYIRFFA